MMAKYDGYLFGDVREIVTEENILKYFGVHSVIGELETADRIYPDVVPIAVDNGPAGVERDLEKGDKKVIAGITVLVENENSVEKMNNILHHYNDCLIARMGLPYREAGVNIITLTLDAPLGKILTLSDAIGRLPGTHVKTSYITGSRKDETSEADRQTES